MGLRPHRHGTQVRMPDERLSALCERADHQIIVLANRAPFTSEPAADGGFAVRRSAGGVVTALEPLVASRGGTWVACGSGNDSADAAIRAGRQAAGVGDDRYRLRLVPLTAEEHRGYYDGFANEGLWPLCHAVGPPPVFRDDDFVMYQAANAQFSGAVVEEAVRAPAIVLLQDYHFALAPWMLRRRLPPIPIVSFWHIPWPRPNVFRSCPWAARLLEGLLGSDIIGLQTDDDCLNFLASVEATLDAEVEFHQQRILYRGHATSVAAYPVGVDWDGPVVRATPPARDCRERVCRELGLPTDVRLAVGVDRLDYTKGIHEKLIAVERLLETSPALQGKFVLVQVAEPSRGRLPAYQAAHTQLAAACERINTRFAADGYRPIRLLDWHHEPADVYQLYRAADLCYVNSLRDGMNLVAKEFVSARGDERGVLVLSERAGAARQLKAALLVNPYDACASAATLARALEMAPVEQSRRMQLLRQNVQQFSAAWWANRLIDDVSRIQRPARRMPLDFRHRRRWTIGRPHADVMIQ